MSRLLKHGSVFLHDPSSWKPPKHYLVENVHLNIHNIAQMYRKRKKGDRLAAVCHSSPRIHPEAFWHDPGNLDTAASHLLHLLHLLHSHYFPTIASQATRHDRAPSCGSLTAGGALAPVLPLNLMPVRAATKAPTVCNLNSLQGRTCMVYLRRTSALMAPTI